MAAADCGDYLRGGAAKSILAVPERTRDFCADVSQLRLFHAPLLDRVLELDPCQMPQWCGCAWHLAEDDEEVAAKVGVHLGVILQHFQRQ